MGRPNPIQEMCIEIDLCPDLLIAIITVAAAAAFFFLYDAITTNGKRKRRRSTERFGEKTRFSTRFRYRLSEIWSSLGMSSAWKILDFVWYITHTGQPSYTSDSIDHFLAQTEHEQQQQLQ